jgi:cystathionine gamma-synthase
VTRDEATFQAFDNRRRGFGAIPGPFETWLALRGMRTLALRVERAQANAQELATRLRTHPVVEEVRYPGFGGMLSVVVRGGAEGAETLTHSTSLWVHATSLGGVESTLERRRRWAGEPDSIPEGLVRLSVGIEDVEDLWRDLSTTLDKLV